MYPNLLRRILLESISSIAAKITKENKMESIIKEGVAAILFNGIKIKNRRKKINVVHTTAWLLPHHSPFEIIPLPITRPDSITGR